MSTTIKKEKAKKSTSKPQKKIAKSVIRKRAYEIYENRDASHGSPENDWLQAEEELLSDPGY